MECHNVCIGVAILAVLVCTGIAIEQKNWMIAGYIIGISVGGSLLLLGVHSWCTHCDNVKGDSQDDKEDQIDESNLLKVEKDPESINAEVHFTIHTLLSKAKSILIFWPKK